MAISGTSIDYTGRTLDMYVSGRLNPLSAIAQPVTYNFGNPSQYTAGVQKLVQRYVISLMNSGLPQQLIGSVVNNIQGAVHTFNLYSYGVVQAFVAYQKLNLNTPLDEQINSVQMTNVSSFEDTITFSLQLTTNAGSNVQFLLPLPLT